MYAFGKYIHFKKYCLNCISCRIKMSKTTFEHNVFFTTYSTYIYTVLVYIILSKHFSSSFYQRDRNIGQICIRRVLFFCCRFLTVSSGICLSNQIDSRVRSSRVSELKFRRVTVIFYSTEIPSLISLFQPFFLVYLLWSRTQVQYSSSVRRINYP